MKTCPACNGSFQDEELICPNDNARLIESEVPSPSEFLFTCLGGMEDNPSPAEHMKRFLRNLALGLGVCILVFTLLILRLPLVARNNSLSAIQSIRAISQAELQYQSTYPTIGYACTLAALEGDPKAGPPSPAAAQILRNDFGGGVKRGSFFEIRKCTTKMINGADRVTGYTVVALPQTQGETGDRGFCSDQSGTLRYDPAGGDDCTLNPAE